MTFQKNFDYKKRKKYEEKKEGSRSRNFYDDIIYDFLL